MACCAVKDCKNNRKFPTPGISFHVFPKGELQKVWLNLIGKSEENWTWNKNKVICSEHFKNEDFAMRFGKRFLKLNSVPSLKLEKSKSKPSCQVISTALTLYSDSEASTSKVKTKLQESTSSTDESILKKQIRRKRKIETRGEARQNTSAASTSTDSSAKQKKIKFVKTIHNYSISPSKVKKMNTDLKQRQAAYRKKLYGANKEIKSLKHKILTMQVVMEHLKKNQSVSENAADHLEKTYGSVPHLLMNRYLKNIKNETITHESYPPVLREFAATLQFYSSKAYEEVRKEFAMALPHQATVRKWYQNVNCEPGFVSAAFDALKLRVEESQSNNKEVFGSLLLDEMSIKKSLEFDGKQMWGYVNVGVPTENDELQPATEVLVIMVVCHTGHWKIPIGYFFIVSLSAKEKANLIRESLIRLHEIGVIITSVTSDGPSTNFAMMKELGCIFDNVHNLKTWFNHPSANSQKVFCILDACHMVKLMRNNFASLQIIKDPNGNNICWSYIKKLYELQENEGLHIANKLKKAHLEWHRQKMKVGFFIK
ncbi:unnamed protein product [Brassicogethes aeneus]|uniref:THAP-type domain-containing protein n=1 Tax=Brassicogethes aeneus TaxID=1431903 RepID=A0A9P0FJ08_BRAAE|nr:unnamed protein product [Brassicogethes aeneus]